MCASGSAVEHLLAKEGVAGSIPVSRSKKRILSWESFFVAEIIINSEWISKDANAKIKTQGFADKELQTVKMAKLYELRLMLTNSAKEQYTTEELVELFDRIAAEKEF